VVKYIGVTWKKTSKKWVARFRHGGKRYHLGLFKNQEDAAGAYDKAAREHHDLNPLCNFPAEGESGPGVNIECTSKYIGLTWSKSSRKWKARIRHGGTQHHLGVFKNPEDAARAYDKAAMLYHENPQCNFPVAGSNTSITTGTTTTTNTGTGSSTVRRTQVQRQRKSYAVEDEDEDEENEDMEDGVEVMHEPEEEDKMDSDSVPGGAVEDSQLQVAAGGPAERTEDHHTATEAGVIMTDALDDLLLQAGPPMTDAQLDALQAELAEDDTSQQLGALEADIAKGDPLYFDDDARNMYGA
jgi:hypothetical protein